MIGAEVNARRRAPRPLSRQCREQGALAFYKMMLTAEMGGKASSIALLDLTPEDKVKAESTQSPDGRTMLVLPATKKLVTKSERKDKNGSSSGTSEVFVGESDGRLWILVPAAAK